MCSLAWINSTISVVRARSTAKAVARGLAVVATAAVAVPVAAVAQSTTDVAANRMRVDAAPLRPGQFEYQTTLEREAATTVIGSRTVSLSAASFAGAPVWLIVERRSGDGIAAADSVFAETAGLHAVHWTSSIGPARVAADFRGETMYGGLSSPAGRRSVVTSVPAGAIISAAMLETVLRLLPLHGAWEDSSSMLAVSLGGNAVLGMRLSVIGEDRIRVPAGQFDCWVVSAHADPARGLYWVTKRDPMVVRSAVDVPVLGGAQLVNALTRTVP